MTTAQKLELIKKQMLTLVEESETILEETQAVVRMAEARIIGIRAKAYWLGHLRDALEGKNEMCSMQDTIDELAVLEDENEEDLDEPSPADIWPPDFSRPKKLEVCNE